jgi:hypothetical protein
MTFDVKEYRARVLKPFKGARNRELQDALRELKSGVKVPSCLDLCEVYDITATMSDADVATRVAEVCDTWNKTASNSVYQTLTPTLTEFHRLLKDHNPNLGTRAFWAARFVAADARGRENLVQFAENVAAEHRTLGIVTEDLVREAATAANIPVSVSADDLAEALMVNGVRVVRPFISPAVPVPDALNGLRATTFRSVIEVVFLEDPPATFSLIDGFSTPGGRALTLVQVQASLELTGRRTRSAENDAAGAALRGLGAAAKDDAKLSAIVLASFLDLARQARSSGLVITALRRLTETGLDRQDAARMLLQLGAAGSLETMAEVTVKVREGKIKEARRLYDLLVAALPAGTASSDADAARTTLENVERRLADLRTVAQDAVAKGDIEAARMSLSEAAAICSDDESFEATLHALPPSSPQDLALALIDNGRGVRVMWGAGFGNTDECRYVVVRKLGSAPRHARDGDVVADGIAETQFEDVRPPLAHEVFYGVAASRGGPCSVAATSHIMLLPGVTNVQVNTDPTSVTVSWSAPPEASAIQVMQTGPDGKTVTSLPVGAHSSATASDLATGATYTYILTAQYFGAAGTVLSSEPQRITGTPRQIATPVTDLKVACLAAGECAVEVQANWVQQPGYDVEVWAFPSKPRWALGTRLPMSVLRTSTGERMAGRTIDSGSRRGVSASTGAGLRHYLAVTRVGEDGLVGAVQELGVCLPVRNPAAQRFGDVTVVTWDSSGPEFSVGASWLGPGGSGRVTIDRARYQLEGGMRLPTGSQGCTITLTTFIERGDASWSSSAVCLSVAGAAATVSYDIKWGRKLFGKGGPATVIFSAHESVHGDNVVVVGKPGHFMPISMDGAQVLTQISLKLDPASPTQAVAVDTNGLGREFWVRAFPSDPTRTRLLDPPSDHLKGR